MVEMLARVDSMGCELSALPNYPALLAALLDWRFGTTEMCGLPFSD